MTDDAGFEAIGIADDKMFKDVFGEDPKLARRLLSLALGREVGEVEYVRPSMEVRPEWDAKSTTFDVYLRTGSGVLGELEMQTGNKKRLPLRLRTHLSNIDRDAIRRGDDYLKAGEAVSVFVCTFDPLGDDLRRYTIRRHVEETGRLFPDRQTGIFLNARGSKGEVPKDLKLFLRYVAGYDGEDVMRSGFVRDVDGRVRANRLDWEWRRRYMTMQELLEDARDEGIELGERRGIELGERRGIELGERRGIELGERRGIELGERRGIIQTVRSLAESAGVTEGEAAAMCGVEPARWTALVSAEEPANGD